MSCPAVLLSIESHQLFICICVCVCVCVCMRQVTLDQIGSHQFFIKQRVQDIDKRLQTMEVKERERKFRRCMP